MCANSPDPQQDARIVSNACFIRDDSADVHGCATKALIRCYGSMAAQGPPSYSGPVILHPVTVVTAPVAVFHHFSGSKQPATQPQNRAPIARLHRPKKHNS